MREFHKAMYIIRSRGPKSAAPVAGSGRYPNHLLDFVSSSWRCSVANQTPILDQENTLYEYIMTRH